MVAGEVVGFSLDLGFCFVWFCLGVSVEPEFFSVCLFGGDVSFDLGLSCLCLSGSSSKKGAWARRRGEEVGKLARCFSVQPILLLWPLPPLAHRRFDRSIRAYVIRRAEIEGKRLTERQIDDMTENLLDYHRQIIEGLNVLGEVDPRES